MFPDEVVADRRYPADQTEAGGRFGIFSLVEEASDFDFQNKFARGQGEPNGHWLAGVFDIEVVGDGEAEGGTQKEKLP